MVILFWASLAIGASMESERVAAGTPLSEVRRIHGTPVLEYPLNGLLIQEYQSCLIVSSNGVVVSADYKTPAATTDKKSAQPELPPSIEEIKQRAMSGDAEAQYILAYCFQFGRLVNQNYNTAVIWYTRSAMQGHMAAQHNLGFLYMNGRGVEKNLAQSYTWALLAAENGNDTLKQSLDYIVSEEQKAVAEERAGQLRTLILTGGISGD